MAGAAPAPEPPMPDADRPTCWTCRFYIECECRRFPPMLVSRHSEFGDYVDTYFPSVSTTQWCGEHQPRQERKESRP